MQGSSSLRVCERFAASNSAMSYNLARRTLYCTVRSWTNTSGAHDNRLAFIIPGAHSRFTFTKKEPVDPCERRPGHAANLAPCATARGT